MIQKDISLPQLSFSKIIRDNIHGYIQLTKLEYDLIQLPVLNRLHNIGQLPNAHLVYPCANETRFEHSLGVMHIASRMIYQILRTAENDDLKTLFNLDQKSPSKFASNCSLLVQKIRLAGLLHDIGHGPFSHASESILKKALTKDEIGEAKSLFNCAEEDVHFHEFFSYKMITSSESEIKKTIEENTEIKAEEIGNLLIGKKSESISLEGSKVIKKIVSSQLDADRMDYLLRDSHTTGVVFGQTDIDRIIMNLSLRKDRLGKYEIAVHERALMSIEDLFDSRFKMYKWVYTHHLIIAFDHLLEHAIAAMIESKTIDIKDFHWKVFAKGGNDQPYILSKLSTYEKADYKGLIDRRYAPTTLLKRTGDHQNFIKLIQSKMGRTTSDKVIVEKIGRWFAQNHGEGSGKLTIKIPSNFEKYKESLKDMSLFRILTPRSPYKELNGNENIWVYNDTDNELKELIKESNYVKAINEEWQIFPSFYLSFIIPGIKKKETKELKEVIKEIIAEEIANI
jgi:HD superfamily phosphohydrolase